MIAIIILFCYNDVSMLLASLIKSTKNACMHWCPRIIITLAAYLIVHVRLNNTSCSPQKKSITYTSAINSILAVMVRMNLANSSLYVRIRKPARRFDTRSCHMWYSKPLTERAPTSWSRPNCKENCRYICRAAEVSREQVKSLTDNQQANIGALIK